jgi:hypothetical protein
MATQIGIVSLHIQRYGEDKAMPKRTSITIVGLMGLALAMNVSAQGRHDEKPHGAPAAPPASSAASELEDAIPLKDGGKLVIKKDGTTYHLDASGKRVRMRDGVVMQGMDGARYMMKSDAVWKTITEKGTMHPSHQ